VHLAIEDYEHLKQEASAYNYFIDHYAPRVFFMRLSSASAAQLTVTEAQLK